MNYGFLIYGGGGSITLVEFNLASRPRRHGIVSLLRYASYLEHVLKNL